MIFLEKKVIMIVREKRRKKEQREKRMMRRASGRVLNQLITNRPWTHLSKTQHQRPKKTAVSLGAYRGTVPELLVLEIVKEF